jgi:hypothetical protein
MPRWPAQTDLQRFARYVKRKGDCLLWTGGQIGRPSRRYGKFFVRGHRNLRAHRWVYEMIFGSVPTGLVLDHLCNESLCVNVLHLEPVPQRVNIQRALGVTDERCVNGHDLRLVRATRYARGRMCARCNADAAARYRERKRA